MWKFTSILAVLSTMHTFIAADTVLTSSVSTTDRASGSGHAFLVIEQVRVVVGSVSHRSPLGRRATSRALDRNLANASLIHRLH